MLQPQLLSVVALLQDMAEKGLRRGQVGTIVEVLEQGAFLVEFSDDQGRCYALEAIPSDLLLQLHHEPAGAAA